MRAVGISVLLFCGTAWAQDPGDYLDTVVVTASRNPVSVAAAGSAVTVIERPEIERRGVTFVVDLLRDVPGLAVSQLGGAGKVTTVRVRGAEANHVLVLIDGVEANDVSQDDSFDFAHLTSADVERIEIVRGAQSALWGSDALAGVINIITRRADPGYRAEASLEAGSFNSHEGRASIAHSGARHHVRLGTSYYETNGTNVSRDGGEADAYHNTTLNLNADLTPADNLRFALNGRVTDIENQSDEIDFVTTGLPMDADRGAETFQSYVGASGDYTAFEGRWAHRLKGTWTLGANEDLAVGMTRGRTRGDKYTAGYQTTVRFPVPRLFDSEHAATFAVDYEKQYFEQRGPVDFFGDPNLNRKRHTLAYIGEYRIALAGGLGLAGSARRDDNSDFADVTTYRGAVTYTLGYTGTVFEAAYATGQKAPTFADRFGFFSTVFIGPPFIGNPNLKPEKSRAWEAGFHQPLLAERLVVGATWFRERLEDEINGFVFDPVLGAFTAANVDGTSRRDGIELTARARVLEHLAANASYTYLDATELDAAGSRIDEVRRPQHQAAFSLAYTFAGGRGAVDLHLTHTGEHTDFFFPPFPQPSSRVPLAPYDLLGLAASYRVTPRVTLFGRLDNMLDEHYEDVLGFRGAGFAAFGGVRLASSGQ